MLETPSVPRESPPRVNAAARPHASRRRVPASAVEARFVDAGGQHHQMPWLQAAGEVALEDCVPVQKFPVQRGRRTAPGWWWSATTGRLVHYGFGAMRTQVMMLDRDPSVAAIACRPVELLWRGRGGVVVSHAPHLMTRLIDGSGVLVDCAGVRGPGGAWSSGRCTWRRWPRRQAGTTGWWGRPRRWPRPMCAGWRDSGIRGAGRAGWSRSPSAFARRGLWWMGYGHWATLSRCGRRSFTRCGAVCWRLRSRWRCTGRPSRWPPGAARGVSGDAPGGGGRQPGGL